MPGPFSSEYSRVESPSREQLDELDALMERMLALPIDPPEEIPLAPGSPVAATAINESTRPEEETPESKIQGSRGPQAAAASNSAALGEEELVPVQVDPSAEETLFGMPRFLPLPTKQWDQPEEQGEGTDPLALFRQQAEPRPPDQNTWVAAAIQSGQLRTPGVLQPLVLLNRGFDWLLGFVGPPGRALKGDLGRWFLGLAGLALLAAAVTWATLELGWIW
jgi:hypothetical protein